MSEQLTGVMLLTTDILLLYAFVEIAYRRTRKKHQESRRHKVQLSCPYCGYEYETEIWVSVKN